ncbi:uncharacterized protein LOC117099817 [Anneissia japonica]|uniref:uncharacterized protein LOC117099817 n=1 Tax=Anneissia japonica TaxID=1529436 RepID=UPI001425B8E7|nr:uncharacterized protein LOC117099817 [Anneissia japonica]
MDVLTSSGSLLDLGKLQMKIGRELISFTGPEGTKFNSNVIIEDTTVILPGHEHILTGFARMLTSCPVVGIVEPNQEEEELAKNGLILARTVVKVEDGQLPLRVFNPGKERRVLREGTTVDKLTPILEDQIESTHTGKEPPVSSGRVPEHLSDLLQRSVASIAGKYHEQVASLLAEFQDVFSRGDYDLGRTGEVKHHINVGTAQPIKEQPRRQTMEASEQINQQVQDLLDRGLIEHSESPWASNVVLVTKKDGTKRFCVDYRRL